jgi:hypothetical protein
MPNPQKRKGDAAEREAAELLSDLLGLMVRRKLGAGRTTAAGGDTGDLEGIPDHVVQVADWANVAAAARVKPAAAAEQAVNANLPHAATMVRFRGGTWRIVLTPAQWARLVRLALQLGDGPVCTSHSPD